MILYYLIFAWALIGAIAFLYLIKEPAPYGKHVKKTYKYSMGAKTGWILMESPAFYLMLIFFIFYGNYENEVHVVLTLLFCLHYFNRSFIWPLRAQTNSKKMPLNVVFSAFAFNTVNVFFQGSWLFFLIDYSSNWLLSIWFLIGLIVFFSGMFINIISDEIMINLKKSNNGKYAIPRGFLFSKVSCPNYFGEFLEWLGWALMTMNLAGLIFFFWTLANLLPRALSNHEWLKKEFENYPKNRKAVIPGII